MHNLHSKLAKIPIKFHKKWNETIFSFFASAEEEKKVHTQRKSTRSVNLVDFSLSSFLLFFLFLSFFSLFAAAATEVTVFVAVFVHYNRVASDSISPFEVYLFCWILLHFICRGMLATYVPNRTTNYRKYCGIKTLTFICCWCSYAFFRKILTKEPKTGANMNCSTFYAECYFQHVYLIDSQKNLNLIILTRQIVLAFLLFCSQHCCHFQNGFGLFLCSFRHRLP